MQTIRCLTYFLKKQIFGANDVLFISNGPSILVSRGDYFRFGSVFFKKITKPVFFLKKNQNLFKPTGFGLVRLV